MGANLILPAGSAAADSTPADPVTRSLRFDGSAYLSRSTGSTSTTWTLSFWVKRATISGPSQQQYFATWAISGSAGEGIAFRGTADSSNLDKIGFWTGSTQHYSTAVYRDPAAWAHICISVNSGTATVYYNGESVISGASGIQAWGSMRLGAWLSQNELEGYIADVYGIEGSALDHTSFTESNDYGGLKPASYSGALGTNGFHLLFENTSSIGEDDAGSNDFSTSGLVSADIRTDVPTDSFCVMSPIDKGGGVTLSEGNLKAVCNTNWKNVRGTMGATSGKFYYEVIGNIAASTRWNAGVDINQKCTVSTYNDNTGSIVYSLYDGRIYDGAGSYSSATQDQSETNARIGVAVDIDAGKVWFRFNNGSWELSGGDPTSGSSSGSVTFTANSLVQPLFAGYGATFTVHFQESEWTDTAPTDFGEWKTSRLADPTVNPAENFNIALYNGTSSSNAITGLGFQPDLLYTKSRSTSGSSPKWFDSLRGVTKRLETHSAGAETTQSTELLSFDSDGFTLGSGSGSNYSGRTYVGWNWKAHQGGPVSRLYTMTLEVNDLWGSGSDWGNTKLEVWEGATKLKDITQPAYNGGSSTTWTIKTNDTDKIKVVWDVDSSMDWTAMYAVLKNSSNTTLASWDGNSYYGGPTPADGSNFYIPSGHDSSNAAVTGVVESSSPTVESYNSAAGFTMIKYAGAGSTDGDTQTLDHSLGVPLEFVIAKKRTSNDGYDNGNWIVWHKDLSSSKYLYLDSNSAQRTEASGYNLISTTNSGSQHQVVVNNGTDGSSYNYHYLNSGPANGTGEDYILYGWAGVEGHSFFGKYTGNGISDGPLVYTGHTPRWIAIKRINSSDHWCLYDTARYPDNPNGTRLEANTQNAEVSASTINIDVLSNGFKLRGAGSTINASSSTYIFASFAESPLKHANAR